MSGLSNPVARCLLPVACCLLLFSTAARATPSDDAMHVFDLLEQERLEDAAPIVQKLRGEPGLGPFVDGMYALYAGEYTRAVERLDTAVTSKRFEGAALQEANELRGLARNLVEITKSFVHKRSAHFDIAVAPGPDELIVDPALAALEKQWANAGADLGEQPPGPIRVEIYGDITDLARVSPLTVEQIETSGTIALCKYNRLMATSPRALVAGYPWIDTIAHELTHFLVNRASHNTVPIWLHEGIAKTEEERWRAPFGGSLSPMQEHLLAAGLRDGHLVTFAQMHPSMALLPSQEDAGLAFAEVTTAIQRLTENRGPAALRKLIAVLRDGGDMDHAIRAVTGESFAGFEKSWRAWLKTRGYKLHPELGLTKLRFKRDAKDAGKDDDDAPLVKAPPVDEKEARARRHLRLGTMMRTRGRLEAAALEYEQAQSLFGAGHPEIAGRLGRTYLELGAWDRAIAAARPGIARRPESAGLKVTVGRALLEEGKAAEAKTYLEGALAVNPYDPQTRCGLAKAYAALHDARETREQSACATLTAR